MTRFQATYFDGKSSRAYPVLISFDRTTIRILGEHVQAVPDVSIKDCTILPPLGKTPRTIRLPDGAQCKTDDHNAVSVLEHYKGGNTGMRLVHFFESRWPMTVSCLIAIVLCTWLFTVHGIPVLADHIAGSVPLNASEELSRQTINVLDENFLKPSGLAGERKDDLRAVFQELPKGTDSDFNFRLEFRKSPRVGPNAFALPSGLIIMTDELVEIADNNRELTGILVHEINHVSNRHGLRSILQNTGVFMLISALVGDVASISSLAASLPALLAQSSYSKKFEREADRAAALYFIKNGWSVKPYQDILLRITESVPHYPGESLLSSHPLTDERIKYLENIEHAEGIGPPVNR